MQNIIKFHKSAEKKLVESTVFQWQVQLELNYNAAMECTESCRTVLLGSEELRVRRCNMASSVFLGFGYFHCTVRKLEIPTMRFFGQQQNFSGQQNEGLHLQMIYDLSADAYEVLFSAWQVTPSS